MTIRIEPYHIAVPDSELVDLRDRLARTRWPDQLPGSNWELGTELRAAHKLRSALREGPPWPALDVVMRD